MGVPQLPIPTLLWLDTTQLTPARDRPHLPTSLQRRGTREFEPCEQTTSSRAYRVYRQGSRRERWGCESRIHEDVPFPPFDVFVGRRLHRSQTTPRPFSRFENPGFRHLGQDAFLVVRVQPGATPVTRASRSL